MPKNKWSEKEIEFLKENHKMKDKEIVVKEN